MLANTVWYLGVLGPLPSPPASPGEGVAEAGASPPTLLLAEFAHGAMWPRSLAAPQAAP